MIWFLWRRNREGADRWGITTEVWYGAIKIEAALGAQVQLEFIHRTKSDAEVLKPCFVVSCQLLAWGVNKGVLDLVLIEDVYVTWSDRLK